MIFILIELISSYWDNGIPCGPYGDDFNWNWCGADSGDPCKEQVQTDQCSSGFANLYTVEGDENANAPKDNYVWNGTRYTYYATYSCSETGM